MALVMAVRIPHPHPFLRRCFYQNKLNEYLRRFVIFVVMCSLLVVFCVPFTAYADWMPDPLDYQQLDYTVKYGSEFNDVSFVLPTENFYFERSLINGSDDTKRVGTNEFRFFAERDTLYDLSFYPVGARGLDLTNIPDGSIIQLNVKLSCDYDYPDTLDYFISQSLLCHHYMDEVGNWLNHKSEQESINDDQISGVYKFEFEVMRPDGAISVVPQILFSQFVSLYSDWYTLEVMSASINMKVSTTYWQQWQNEQNGQQLNDIQQGIEDTNEKLDDVISGGEEGAQLENDTGKLDQSAGDISDGVGKVDKFEEDLFADVEDNLDDIIAGANMNGIVPSLKFVQKYVDKIFLAIPTNYRVVFTLPIFFGIFLFIVGHPVRAPRPDTSGDIVTRETFTTTEVLSGRNAGRITTTRTVTQSQITNRSSPE